jgi:hypothetical protein
MSLNEYMKLRHEMHDLVKVLRDQIEVNTRDIADIVVTMPDKVAQDGHAGTRVTFEFMLPQQERSYRVFEQGERLQLALQDYRNWLFAEIQNMPSSLAGEREARCLKRCLEKLENVLLENDATHEVE